MSEQYGHPRHSPSVHQHRRVGRHHNSRAWGHYGRIHRDRAHSSQELKPSAHERQEPHSQHLALEQTDICGAAFVIREILAVLRSTAMRISAISMDVREILPRPPASAVLLRVSARRCFGSRTTAQQRSTDRTGRLEAARAKPRHRASHAQDGSSCWCEALPKNKYAVPAVNSEPTIQKDATAQTAIALRPSGASSEARANRAGLHSTPIPAATLQL